MSFADLGLKPELLRAVVEKGYTVPTPIQAQAIPAVLTGGDVLAGAQTGTGKTAAFVLPVLQKLGQAAGRAPRALVLTPTRELAAQVAESARTYGRYAGLRTLVVFGGVSINPQIDSLHAGCDLLVATPGRLLDLVEQGALDLRSVQVFVLDEADRMLDMGFIPAIRRVVRLLPPQRQNLMFSATYSDDIRELAGRILRNPVNIEVSPRNATAERVDQQVYRVSKEHKRHLLAHLIHEGNWHQVLVFTRTKHGANRLSQQLESNGIRAAAIHGNKSQGARVRALSDFKSNKITALVATEVAARGLDIKELPHVVNYELPNVPEDYVHRIGRTARAGGSGCAVSLVSPDEAPLLKDIERMLRRSLPVSALPQFEIVAAPAAPRGDSDSGGRRGGGVAGRSNYSARRGNGGGHHGGGRRDSGDARGNSRHASHAPHADHSGRHGNGGGQHADGGRGNGDARGNSDHADHPPRTDHSGQPGNGGGQRAGDGHGIVRAHGNDNRHSNGGGHSAGGGRGSGGRHGNGGGHGRPGQQPRRFSPGGQRPRATGGRSSGGR